MHIRGLRAIAVETYGQSSIWDAASASSTEEVVVSAILNFLGHVVRNYNFPYTNNAHTRLSIVRRS